MGHTQTHVCAGGVCARIGTDTHASMYVCVASVPDGGHDVTHVYVCAEGMHTCYVWNKCTHVCVCRSNAHVMCRRNSHTCPYVQKECTHVMCTRNAHTCPCVQKECTHMSVRVEGMHTHVHAHRPSHALQEFAHIHTCTPPCSRNTHGPVCSRGCNRSHTLSCSGNTCAHACTHTCTHRHTHTRAPRGGGRGSGRGEPFPTGFTRSSPASH